MKLGFYFQLKIFVILSILFLDVEMFLNYFHVFIFIDN